MQQKSFVIVGVLALAGSVIAQEQRSAEQQIALAWARIPAEGRGAGVAGPPPGAMPGIRTTVNVLAEIQAAASPQPVSTVELTGKEITASAGTWGDLPRYLQTLPGTLGTSDMQNAFSVRGGNSFENLFTVDGIEVPNLNHIALAGTTGGLGSMLDTETIHSVVFHSADLSAAHTSRLSSLTEIRTLGVPDSSFTTVNLGYSGAGIRMSRLQGSNRSLLFTVRESVTNLVRKDIGLNGSPEFTNALFKYTVDLSPRDHLWLDAIGGRDRLKVRPTWLDLWETNAFDTDYDGWRNTTGFVWQHTMRSDAVGTIVFSNSQDVQHLNQQNQDDPVLQLYDRLNKLKEFPFTFTQNSNEGTTQIRYDYQYADENGSGSNFGLDLHASRVHNRSQQTGDIFSPYSVSTTPRGAFAYSPSFSALDRAAFFDVNQNLKRRLFVRAGTRFQNGGLANTGGTKSALLPHASVSLLATARLNVRFAYSRSAQLPPFSIIGATPGNAVLGLIRNGQWIAGGALQLSNRVSVNVEAYSKTYAGYPVSVDYPQVSLATIAPVIDEPFQSLTMRSGGRGESRGVEISMAQSPVHHMFTRANLTFSRSRFSGSDGVLRPGTNDLPFVLNVMSGMQLGRYSVTARETMASGRLYTPALLDASFEQNRMIFDLSQLNALRGSVYNRLDLAVNRDFRVFERVLQVHLGALNVLNRGNVYGYQWRPRCVCGPIEQKGMGLEPDVHISYTF